MQTEDLITDLFISIIFQSKFPPQINRRLIHIHVHVHAIPTLCFVQSTMADAT